MQTRTRKPALLGALALSLSVSLPAAVAAAERVVDIATPRGVTERLLVVEPDGEARAAVLLFAGGHGGLRIGPNGQIGWGKKNFLVRARRLLAARGLVAVVVDAPSDRQHDPFLSGFRTRRAHAEDIAAVIAWVRRETHLPVWLAGTSRGTVSAAFCAIDLAGSADGPDGLVLTSTILVDEHDTAVPDLDLGRLRIPVLLVHHVADGCRACPVGFLSRVERKLSHAARHETVTVSGGVDEGDRCEALAHHGFNGQEAEVMDAIAGFVLAR